MLAQNINQRCGGTVVTPWNLDEVPEDFRQAFDLWTVVDKRERVRKKNERYFADFRRRMKYRQY